jgi:hypothetical protein
LPDSIIIFSTPLHISIESDNAAVVDLLLDNGASTEIMSSEGYPPLWFALKSSFDFGKDSLPARLVVKGASTSAVGGNA